MKDRVLLPSTMIIVELPSDLHHCLSKKKSKNNLSEKVVNALRQHFAKDLEKLAQKSRLKPAPLDRFLPQGTDPFSPALPMEPKESHPICFERIHKRNQNGRIPRFFSR